MRSSPAYSRPTLTPLGQRLLHLSDQKLHDLDYPKGFRDSGYALFRSVLLRETVRSTQVALADEKPTEMNDWTSPTALGLDVLGEVDEEAATMLEDEEEKWFDDLLAELAEEDELYHAAEVCEPIEQPITPLLAAVALPDEYVSPLDIAQPDASTKESEGFPSATTVDIYQVEDVETLLDCSDCTDHEISPETNHLSTIDSRTPPALSSIIPADRHSHANYLIPLEDIDECDALSLPSLLHRSWSRESSDSDQSECPTPPVGCEGMEDLGGVSSEESDEESEEEVEEDYAWPAKGVSVTYISRRRNRLRF